MKNDPLNVIIQTEPDREYLDFICPGCHEIIDQYRKGSNDHMYMPKYHGKCGQTLEWSLIAVD